jgi:hypothetical protein
VTGHKKTMAIVAVALAGTISFAPSAAYAAGPTKICYSTVGVSEASVSPGASVSALLSWSGAFMFTGQYIQNGNYGYSSDWGDYWAQSETGDYILVGSVNYSTGPLATQGWMVDTWQCS